jgi:hypothetical protein
MLNLGQMRPETAAEVIAHAAKELRRDGQGLTGIILMEIIPLQLIPGVGFLLVTLDLSW